MNERIERLKVFLKDTPDDCFLNHALALEQVKAGNDREAKILFEKNMQHDMLYIATYYHLGKLLERLGQEKSAIEVYEKGMQASKSQGDMHTYNELQSAYEDLVY